jgi:hypothetical protein
MQCISFIISGGASRIKWLIGRLMRPRRKSKYDREAAPVRALSDHTKRLIIADLYLRR